jgi:hypothetical protein
LTAHPGQQELKTVKKTLPVDDPIRELCRLCRIGKLFAVEDWCRAGKPIQPSVFHHSLWPVGIAIEKGFHSLLEVFLRNGAPPDPRTLWSAVRWRRREMVELLFSYGADARAISFQHVIAFSDPEIVKMFVDRGADLVTGYPLAGGLIQSPRGLLRLCKELLPSRPELMLQVNMALRHFSEKGNMRGVSLMLWLGGDARAKVPTDQDEEESLWETSLHSAVSYGRLEIIKKFRFNPAKDNLKEEFRSACCSCDLPLIRYFLEMGADANRADEHGATPLGGAICHLNWKIDFGKKDESVRTLEELISVGVKWTPPSKEELSRLRRFLGKLSFYEAYELIKKIKQTGFCTDETLILALNTPAMRRHLQPRVQALAKLLPYFDRWNRRAFGRPLRGNRTATSSR